MFGREDVPVYLCRGVTDMRAGADRLAEKVRGETGKSVRGARGLYVFFSRCRRRVKALWWDDDGYALFSKRLEAGCYRVERRESGYEEVTSVDLRAVLSGVDLSRVRLRRHAEVGVYG